MSAHSMISRRAFRMLKKQSGIQEKEETKNSANYSSFISGCRAEFSVISWVSKNLCEFGVDSILNPTGGCFQKCNGGGLEALSERD
jgi:hypothetical protein